MLNSDESDEKEQIRRMFLAGTVVGYLLTYLGDI
jgi:hypothetical protein